VRIAIGSDHNGVEFKSRIGEHLASRHHEVIDVGPRDSDSVDYPDYAFAVAEKVAGGEAERGILICGSGVGMAMAANKVKGVRAALCLTAEAAGLARGHNNANVLTLAGWQGDAGDALDIVDRFMETAFEGGRHARRVDKMTAYEERTKP